MWILDIFSVIFEHFSDPKKRVFIGYIFLSICIAFLWLVLLKKISIKDAFWKVFDKRVFFAKSSQSDYLLFLLNRGFTFFVSPLLISQIAIATIIFHFLHKIDLLTSGIFSDISKTVVVILFTFFVFILDDLTKYFVHRWMHKWPILWSLHKVHHSATQLTPITIYRTHPLEGIVFSLRAAFTQGVSISLFIYLFGNNVDLLTILGVNILVFAFNVAGSNLRHSHIGIRYWKWLEFIFISPAQHQLHHSVAEEHHDKNFGASLAIWDWFFGSLHHSTETETLTLGLDEFEKDYNHSLFSLYVLPLKEISFHVINKIKIIQPFFSHVLSGFIRIFSVLGKIKARKQGINNEGI